jgi:glycosyl hydrolase family 18 (putative chitinase)
LGGWSSPAKGGILTRVRIGLPSQLPRRSSARWVTVLLGAILSTASLVAPVAASARTVDEIAPASLTVSSATHHLSAEVVGYLPYWEMKAETFADLDLTKVTSIVLFSVGWNAAGHLVTDAPGYRAITSSGTGAFVAAARAAGVRVLVSFTSFGASKNAAFFSNAASQATFVKEAAAFVAAQGLDGADLDVELISSTYFAAYAATAGALRGVLRKANPAALLTVATNGNTSGAKMAGQAIAAGADRAFLMGYSYRTAGSAPGLVDPLARTGTSLSLGASLDLYSHYAVPLDHVLLGLPLYGRSWPTVDATVGSPRRTDVTVGDGDAFFFQDLATMRATGTLLAEDYVPLEEGTRLVRSVSGVVWQSFYDSQANLETKMRVALQRHLAGVGLWALGYSTGHPEYWTAIDNVFGPPTVTRLAVVPSPTNTRTVSVRLTWNDGANPATEMRLANGTAPFGAWRPIAAAIPWILPTGPTVVRRTIRVQLRDGLGATSLVAATSVVYDHANPTITRLTVTWSSTARAWIIRYGAKDTGSGVVAYRIALKRNGISTTLAMRRTSTSYVLRIAHSAHFRISVRAIDRAGNFSAPVYFYH